MGNDFLMDVQHLSHIFRLNRKVEVHAVDDVSFQIKKGEIYGLVGESGSGKSTVARCVMNIYKPSAGEIYYKGIPVCKNREFKKNRKVLQMTRQMIFQDSASSLNPGMKVGDIVAEPLRIQSRKIRIDKKEIEKFHKELGLAMSVDDLLMIRDYFKSDERIKYFYKENTGVSDTRNYGVNQAMGEYIIFVDSDDYISKTLLRSLQCVTACKCIINKRALMLLFP